VQTDDSLCFSKEPRSFFSDGVYPKKMDAVGARSAQLSPKPCTDEKPSVLDRRLRTDDETIRAQSTILG
jgi:hypothetical protein